MWIWSDIENLKILTSLFFMVNKVLYHQNGKTKQSKKSKEASIKLIIAACLFPFIIVFFLITVGMLILIIKSIVQKGIPHEEKESVAIETVTEYIESKYGDVLTYSGVRWT